MLRQLLFLAALVALCVAQTPIPAGTTWQWQLSGVIDTSIPAELYDIDLFDAPQSVIDELLAQGRFVICYFSAGSREDWRPDADDFPAAVVGRPLDGWAGERWLDVSSYQQFATIMQARLDLAVLKNCTGVEPDNVDGYTANSGFSLTAGDQLTYNRWLAAESHARGLSVALKNDLDQVGQLVSDFDFAVNEQCHEYDECDVLQPFIDQNKAVLVAEYSGSQSRVCAGSSTLSIILKDWDLTSWVRQCFGDFSVLGSLDPSTTGSGNGGSSSAAPVLTASSLLLLVLALLCVSSSLY